MLRDLRRGSAHDPRDADHGVGTITDHTVNARVTKSATCLAKFAHLTIKGFDSFSSARCSDLEPCPGEALKVVGVGGLSEFKHQIVRRIDNIVDGPHPSKSQSLSNQAWRVRDRDVRKHSSAKAWAESSIEHLDRDQLCGGHTAHLSRLH